MCTFAVASIVFWHPGLHVADLPLFLLFLVPLYLPMAYHAVRQNWLRRQQESMGLPAASDDELLSFISEGLDEAFIDWEWQGAAYGGSLWHVIAIGPEDDPIFVKANSGLLEVEWGGAEFESFLDPIDALAFLCVLKNRPPPRDADMYGEDEGADIAPLNQV